MNTQWAIWNTHLPNVKPYYAVKCNPDPWLMTWLSHKGVGFDCASVREVNAVKKITKADILFANPCKKRDEIIQSSVADVSTTVVDSHEEIDKLNEIGFQGNSFIRIQVEDAGSMMPFSAKFGLEVSAVMSLAKYAKIKGQPLNGISFHVGSGCKDPLQYKSAIHQAYDALAQLRVAGHSANIVDIGGGFMSEGFAETAKIIRESQNGLKFIAEPGRFFAATSHDLFVRVIGKKAGKKGIGWRYTLDESLYGQFSCIPFDHAQPRWIRVRGANEEPRKKTSAVLYGRTCDSVDFIAAADEAEELMEGDLLWFPNMGAYTTVTSTEFNGFPKPPSIILESHSQSLPDPKIFLEHEWPQGLKYASAVKVPI